MINCCCGCTSHSHCPLSLHKATIFWWPLWLFPSVFCFLPTNVCNKLCVSLQIVLFPLLSFFVFYKILCPLRAGAFACYCSVFAIQTRRIQSIATYKNLLRYFVICFTKKSAFVGRILAETPALFSFAVTIKTTYIPSFFVAIKNFTLHFLFSFPFFAIQKTRTLPSRDKSRRAPRVDTVLG